ncbi:MAG: hypothetical protein GC171_10665 [Terrimonas sp.]|nr:hypothetical protein [Terrimonas sp.]
MKQIFIYITFASTFLGCSSGLKNKKTSKILSEVTPKGFCLNKAPNTLDVPGKIFRVDTVTEEVFYFDYLPVKTNSGEVALSSYQTNNIFNGRFLFSMLGVNQIGPSYRIFAERKYNFEFQLTKPVLNQISDVDFAEYREALAEKIKEIEKKSGFKNCSYHIIRETISTNEILLSLNSIKGFSDSLDIQTKNNIVNSNSNLSFIDTTKSGIKATFNKPLQVFYKTEALRFGGGDGPINIKFRKTTSKELEIINKEQSISCFN